MASISKREFAKKDMNFFSEFAASSQAMARIMGYMIIIGIVVVGLMVTLCVIQFIRWGVIKAEVKKYDDLFATEEYTGLQGEADELAKKSAHTNEYGYVVSEMKSTVDRETGVSFDIISELEKHIPSNTIITYYEIDKGHVVIGGTSHSYYAMTEIVNMLQENKYFTNVNFEQERWDASEVYEVEVLAKTYINGEYLFKISASLDTEYLVSVTAITVDNNILQVKESEMIEAGKIYETKELTNINVAGNNYVLSAVNINGATLNEEDFANVMASDTLKVEVYDDLKIQLTYTLTTSGEGE